MRFISFFLLFLVISLSSRAQDSLSLDFSFKKEISAALGYNYSFAGPNTKNYHLLEGRVQQQRFGGRHPTLLNLNAGVFLGLNTENFLISPVIGGVIGYGGIIIGLDLAYFTDFEQGTLRLIPYLGFGLPQIRLSINPHIRLTNAAFEPINRGHVNLTVRLFKIKSK